jgi:hypothetical protein
MAHQEPALTSGTASVVGSTVAGVVNVAVAPMVIAVTDGWTNTVFVGASPDPASVLVVAPPLSRATVKTPAPTTAAAAHAAPINFTPRRLVGVRFVFIFGSLRAFRRDHWIASVSSLIYASITAFAGLLQRAGV